MIRKAKEGGLLMFSMSVPSHQILEELYIPCNKCYSVEAHPISQCSNLPTTKYALNPAAQKTPGATTEPRKNKCSTALRTMEPRQ